MRLGNNCWCYARGCGYLEVVDEWVFMLNSKNIDLGLISVVEFCDCI